MHTYLLKSPEDTAKKAEYLASLVECGDVILLSGELGAGKSTFARAFIHSYLGQEVHVQSPTFPLIQIYEQGKCELWHCDFYRLEDPEEVLELGIEEAYSKGITLIEWPEKLGPYKPKIYLHLALTVTPQPLERELRVTSVGARWQDIDFSV